MAGGNLGDLWFDLNIKDSNVRSKLKEISEALSELDLKTESGRKSAEKLFKNFNRENSKEIAEDFKNIAAQMGIQAQETANLSKRLKELSELKADILRRDKEQSEHGNFVAMKNEAQAALDLTNRYNELAKLKEDILRRDKEMEAQGAFVTLVNESKQAQELNERYREMQQLKSAILERDRQSTEHGNFVAMKNEAQAAQELAVRERELAELRNAIVRRNEEMIAAENRLREATERTNQARREAISVSRKQAESLVRDRVKELEAQRIQLQGLFGSGKNTLSTEDLARIRAAFSQITSELNTLRGAMANLSGYSIRDLFSMGRGTSDYSPLIRSMESAISQKQKAVDLERKHQQEIALSAAKVRNDLAAAFAGANAEAKKMQSIVGDIKSLFLQGGIVFGAQQFFNSIVQTGGEIVQQHVALRSILGDVQKADELFAQTQQLALQSPFKFGELNRDVKQLAAFGVEANDLYDTTKRLADIASGLGVSFERLGLAYGQVKARSWLDGKELRQFAYAGLPLLQRITELYNSEGKNGRNNYTQADVKKMITARQVSFEDVQKVLWKMTDEGGQFYNMQFVLSETLLGRWNKLIDAWDIMLGKFAEGKNIVGGTFSFIINRVTDLVLALDKLSPALLSFGAVFAARKLGGMAYSKMGIGSLAKSYTQQMNAQLKSYAIEQQQLVVEGEITQKIAQQNVFKRAAILSEKQSLVASYNRAALEGRMSVLQMQRAVKEGLVSKEIIRQLALMGQITAKQEQIILNGGRMSAVWSMTTSKIGGFVNAIGGWWGIGITTITSLLMGYNQWSSRVKEEEKTLIDGAKQKSKSYGDFLSGLGPKDASNLSSQVDSMKEILKSSDDYTDSIKQQVESAGSLSKQYDILKEKIDDAKKANDGLADKYGVITNNATSATGLANDNLFDMIGADTPLWLQWLNGLTNDDIAKNVEQAQESLSKFQVMFDELDSSTKTKMEDFIRSLMENNEELANQIKGLPLTEQIRMLAAIGGDDWEKFVDKFANGSKETENWLKELSERAKESSDDVSEIMYDDVPRGLESVRKQLGLSQDQFRTWAKRNPEIFASMMDKMAQKANITSKTILYYFHSAISKLMDMDFWPGDSGNGKQGKPSYNSGVNTPFSEIIRQRLHKNGTFTGNKKKGKFWTREVDNALRQVQDQSFETTGENIRKELKAARNELDTIVNGKVSKNSSEYKNAKHKYDLWKAIAKAGYISDDLGKNKVTGNFGKDKNKNGREEDKQLKNLRERIELYKKMYAEIKKFKELYGEGALGQLANDGEFEAIFGDKKRFPISDYTNYETSIKELLKTLPASTKDRLDYAANEKAGIQTENRKLLEDQRRDDLNVLNKQLDVISEQYDTYKKIYELTGNKKGSENIAFGRTVQFDTYKRFLEEQLDIAVKHDNVQSGLNLTMDEVKGMSLENVKDKYGEETRVYDIRKKLEGENNKIKKETIDLMANLIENNATIAQQIEDENRKYERQLELIKGIEDPQMRERASEGATKTHNENVAKLQFEQFKQESDWVAIFDDLDRVSSATINTMINNIDEFSRTTGLSIEVVKQLRDALDKLRNEQIDRNPLPSVFGGVRRGNAIGDILKSNRKIGASGINISDAQAKKTGLIAGKWYSNADLENSKKGAYNDSSKAITSLSGKMQALSNIMDPVINLFEALGEQNSILGQIAGGASNAFSAAANVSGGLSALGLGAAGPYGAAAAAALSVGSSLIKAFGADYSSYEKAKAEYDNLTSIWDSLISKKTEYMNIHWGTEAIKASKEAQEMLKAEIEQTKVIAQKRLNSGSSAGSHSIWYRMWKGSYKYNGQNWRDVAGDISSKYGVQFNGMEDMLNMNADTLSEIKKNYTGLWANMDSEFRDYLEKLIQYGDKADDMVEAITEKLTGNKFSDLVSSWGDAMATMANSSDNLVEHFEDNLKKTILNSMIENLYKDKINALLEKTKKYGDPNGGTENIKDSNGNVISEYTGAEYADVKNSTEDLSKQIEATRDFLKKTYGWSDNSSSSSRNSVKEITEETADILLSYVNAIRLDCSVMRAEQAKYYPEMSEIAKSQLTQLNAIARNTLRNADAAERIERIFVEYNDNFNRVLNGTKSLKMK
nr:MAG TPA: Tape measure domain protein [Bacteriophage sp.]